MEKVEERLTVLKDYMTLSDMKNYFQISTRTVDNWEKDGLKICFLNRESKYYKKEDIIEFLDSKRA
ncbi:hypothetical protein [Anaerococcus sp. Marseille-P3625]|uniref:hypothetical protein n=1 Tax=Anaerococcus sp. Marseille-P3625 TaxID=1977277 RepID=UPI002151C7E1|nr:hypothetical protein [Anaerococcus sp. Marseille-P3625]